MADDETIMMKKMVMTTGLAVEGVRIAAERAGHEREQESIDDAASWCFLANERFPALVGLQSDWND